MNELTKAQILDLVTSLYNGEGSEDEVGNGSNCCSGMFPTPTLAI